jgi:hypothetical protein
MSSHREAPEISKDPVADSADLYAFVSPDAPSTVTLIANYVPLQLPAGGPNFYEFGDDVLYEIHIDNDNDGDSDITYQFRFTSELTDPQSFLYNTGQITSLASATWNRRQFYSVTRVDRYGAHQLATNIPCPPCNIGPRSIPSYGPLAQQATTKLPSGEVVFAGQRADGFYVDLGSLFDLGDLRPFEQLHLIPTPAASGVNGTAGLNVHSIAVQVPISSLTHQGRTPSQVMDPFATIGVWTTASRQRVRVADGWGGDSARIGPWTQVSRLGNPLFNEVIVPIGMKDRWNSLPPAADEEFLSYVQHPELAGLLPVLYPGVFPNLQALTAARADLAAILLTGIPAGVVPGFQNYTGATNADMLRLNVAVPPTTSNPSIFGLLGGDAAGYPNGRRVFDDVVTIELRAIAGITYPLVMPTYTPDGAAGAIYDVVDPSTTSLHALGAIGETYLSSFPYLGTPWDGFDNPAATPKPVLANP